MAWIDLRKADGWIWDSPSLVFVVVLLLGGGVEERSRQAVLSWVTQISCFMQPFDITLNNYIFLPTLISIVLAHG